MDKLAKAIIDNQAEIKNLIKEKPDWKNAYSRFDTLYNCMSNPSDKIWRDGNFNTFKEVYFAQRDKDKGMGNIIARTVSAMPEKEKHNCKIMFLQMAEVCCLFNASHKVNFEAVELPMEFNDIKMVPTKSKGIFTYARPIASIYKKTSLTFDYWVPKFIEWSSEIRSKKLKDWKGEAILEHETCTDFMRICLMFISDVKNNVPIAKTEDRESLLNLFGEEFIWIKKSAKREDIPGNNKKIIQGFSKLEKQTNIKIPLESWNRILYSSQIKNLIK